MKKVFTILMAIIILVSISACGSNIDKDEITSDIAGRTWTGKESLTEYMDSNQGGQSRLDLSNSYTITFNDDGTCDVHHESVTKYDSKFNVETLRGATVDHEYDYECTWSVKIRGENVIVTLSCNESMGMVPYVFTLCLNENGRIISIEGTNNVNDPVVFNAK